MYSLVEVTVLSSQVVVQTANLFCNNQIFFVRRVYLKSSYHSTALFDVVSTQEREGEGRISCVGGGGIPFSRRNVSR